MTALRHAIIGCGRVAPNHVAGFRQVPGCEFVWACDRDGRTLEDFVRTHAITQATTDYSVVLADASVTSVSIAVDHAQHAAIARQAMLSGKHVLLEKPMALSLEDAAGLGSLAEEHGLVFSIVAQHRFDPLFLAVRNLVDSGKLGRLVSIWVTLVCGRTPEYYTDSYWRGKWEGEGGSLFTNQAYHCLDLLSALAGVPQVLSCDTAILALGGAIETEDVTVASLRFPSGALGLIGCTSATREFWRSRFDVIGSEGSVVFDIDHPAKLDHVDLPAEADAALLKEAAEIRPELPAGISYYGISHNRQIADFCDAIRMNRAPEVGAREGLATLTLIAELYRKSGSAMWSKASP